MPFAKIKRGRNRGKYRSPSGNVFSRSQVTRYYARGGTFDSGACRCCLTHDGFSCDAARTARRDPTLTLDLRRAMIKDLDRRWRAVQKMITDGVATKDIFGVGRQTAATIQTTAGAGGQHKAFQNFADQAMQQIVLGQDRGHWISRYVTAAYDRGWNRMARDVKRTDLKPIQDRADLLTSMAITELQGVMEAVSQNLVRVFGEGLVGHQRPAEMARLMRRRIDAIGTVRSRDLAQFMIVKANNEAALDILAVAGHTHVGIIPETLPSPGRRQPVRDFSRHVTDARRRRTPVFEVVTAGDDDVCPICEDLEAEGPYTMAEARNLLPAHPNCRCAWAAVDRSSDPLLFGRSDSMQPLKRPPAPLYYLRPEIPPHTRVGYWTQMRDAESDAYLTPLAEDATFYRGIRGLLPRVGMKLTDKNFVLAAMDAADVETDAVVVRLWVAAGTPVLRLRDAVVLPRGSTIELVREDEDCWNAVVT